MWPSGSSSSPGLAAEEGGLGGGRCLGFASSLPGCFLSKLQWKLTKMSPQNEV